MRFLCKPHDNHKGKNLSVSTQKIKKKESQSRWETIDKISVVSPYISIITFYINILNYLSKRND
jgi:hypothetical protein